MKSLWPSSLSGQIILLLVAVVAASQILSLLFLSGERRIVARTSHLNSVMDRLVSEAEAYTPKTTRQLPFVLYENTSPPSSMFVSRNNHARRAGSGGLDLDIAARVSKELRAADISFIAVDAKIVSLSDRGNRPRPRPMRPPPPRPDNSMRDRPREDRPELYRAPVPRNAGRQPGPGFEELIVSVELEPGIWLNSLAPYYSAEAISMRAIATSISILFVAIILAVLIARRMTKPIKDMGLAAERLGRGEQVDPLPVSGPRDVASSVQAFNTMQDRLGKMLEEQRATLRAVGHDLRTPITALRIRAESIADEHTRDKIVSGLDTLSEMMEEILNWSRDLSATENLASVRLDALIETIAEDYTDQGANLTFVPSSSAIVINCRRLSLRRAITNLIDNALKYAGSAELKLIPTSKEISIEVTDDGPGIPDHKLKDVLEPFVRIETSRNRDTGGMGLGLSIARSIALAHGGALHISNAENRGVRAVITLPVDP